jgi:methylenetetrahydrofolate dehydrogenase (NADP+) / methenyltetrahydrofolate cyclohydrolase / formyltetrahydrofolate synthetase
LQKKLPNFLPGLAIVQVGGREDSNVYIRMKIKAATDIGIHAEHVRLPRTITEGELLTEVWPFCDKFLLQNRQLDEFFHRSTS